MSSHEHRLRRPAVPVRPARLQDEWSETYLGRAARLLGLRRPWRADLETLRPLLPAIDAGREDGRPAYGPEPLPDWAADGRGAQIKFCPQCFTEKPYIRQRWRIPFLTVCTVHGIALKRNLVEPAITSDYKRPEKRTVNDVSPDEAWAGATCPTPAGLMYAKAIWGTFEQAVCSDATADVLADRLAWSLLAERMVDAVVTARYGPDYPTKQAPRHEHRGWWLNKGQLRISPDRVGVLTFILGQSGAPQRRAILRALTRMIVDEVRKRSIMSRLPLIELKERLLAAQPAEAARGCGALPRSMHPPGCKSMEAVQAILGCQESLVHLLVRDQHFKGSVQIQFGRKRYIFVPDAEVERVRRYFSTCMTFDELLETLAIDKPAYWALHDSGIVSPIELGSWRRYRRQDVSALLSRLDSVSMPWPVRSLQLEPLMGDWLHMRRRPRFLIKQLLGEVLEGSVPIFKRLDREGLQAYFVDHTAPARLRWLTKAHHATNAMERNTAAQLALWELA